MENTKQQKLKQSLRKNTFTRYENSSSGEKLDTSKLHLIGLDKNIFLSKVKGSGRKYNMEILVDVSGSMFGCYMYECMGAVMNIVKLLYGIVDMNIVFYDYLERAKNLRDIFSVNMEEIAKGNEFKELNAKFKRGSDEHGNVTFEICEKGTNDSCAGNWEICNIVNAYERLSHKSGDNIIVVIGDGRMNLDNDGGSTPGNVIVAGKSTKLYNYDTYRSTTKKIEKDTKLLGIGLGCHSFDGYITDNKTISQANDVDDVIVDFMLKHYS